MLLYSLESICSIRRRSCSTLEYSRTSCLTPWNHCEEKCEKSITRRINNKSPSHFSFDACRHGVEFWKAGKIYFFHLGKWKNSFSRGKMYVFVWRKHYSSSRNSESILMTYLSLSFSFHAAALNLHVSPKTEIYLDFSIKNAGFVFVVKIIYATSQFSHTISTVLLLLVYRCWVKFGT